MRKITWSPESEQDYEENIAYLLVNWSEVEAQNFIDKVDDLLFLLKQGVVEFKWIDYEDIRKKNVIGPIVLLYRETATDIELVKFGIIGKNQQH